MTLTLAVNVESMTLRARLALALSILFIRPVSLPVELPRPLARTLARKQRKGGEGAR